MADQNTVFVQMALKAWNGQVNNANKFFAAISDDDMQKEVAPGKNRIIYLLGHLIAVNDGMIKLFGLGDRLYEDYDFPFLKSADKM
ncbi:MAG: DinB family protein, partial [Chitinophagaceae bacterium]